MGTFYYAVSKNLRKVVELGKVYALLGNDKFPRFEWNREQKFTDFKSKKELRRAFLEVLTEGDKWLFAEYRQWAEVLADTVWPHLGGEFCIASEHDDESHPLSDAVVVAEAYTNVQLKFVPHLFVSGRPLPNINIKDLR
jgi:hypothetical protein